MKDATMRQGNGLLQLVLQAEDSHGFGQRLIENWGAVKIIGEGRMTYEELMEALQHVETGRNPYPATRAENPFSIPKDYAPARGEELAQRLQAARPGIDLSHLDQLIASCKVPGKAEGAYAAPKVSYEANLLGLPMEAARRSFGILITQGCNALRASVYDSLELDPAHVQVVEETWSALMLLERQQPGDVMVFPAQTGTLYAGHRSDWSRYQMKHARRPGQWPISPYEAAWMLVGNPHRLTALGDLGIDCPGVYYSYGGNADSTLGFGYNEDSRKRMLQPHFAESGPFGVSGSASGFFPQ